MCYCQIEQYDNMQTSKKYNLCIMAIFKNEQDYLEEWLKYHLNQGINHFYLFSNDENMQNYPYLVQYTNYITMIPWTDKTNDGADTIQRQAYYHCVKNYSSECEYLMMLDIDEFIVSLNDKNVSDVIKSLGDNIKAIKVQRYNFGSNGHIKKPIGNVMDAYKKHEIVCSSYKTIANCAYLDTSKKFYGVHDFVFLDKLGKVYNDYFNYKFTGFPNECKEENVNEVPLVINHYYTKSYNEYLDRCKLWENGGINNYGYRKDCAESFEKKNKNEIEGY